MKRYFFVFLLLFTVTSYAQKTWTKEDYKIRIKKFYSYLFSDKPVTFINCKKLFGYEGFGELDAYLFEENCKKTYVSGKKWRKLYDIYVNDSNATSIFFKNTKEQLMDIPNGLDKEEMFKYLEDSCELIDLGESSAVYIKTKLNNKEIVYFVMEKYIDEPYIGNIMMPDGASVSNKMYPKDKIFLKILGKINDPEGYVNIRKEANAKSPIVGTINNGEKFTYTPNSNSLWWKVQKDRTTLGYVYYDRLMPDKK